MNQSISYPAGLLIHEFSAQKSSKGCIAFIDYAFIKTTINVGRITAPIAFNIPLELFANHVVLAKGTDVDRPRNLAKSVTVE